MTTTDLVPLSDQMAYAEAVVWNPKGTTSLLPQAYQGNPAAVMIAMGLGQAIGLTPAQSLYEIYVVNGRPSPSANLMAAVVRRAGHKLRLKGDSTFCTATLIRHDDPDVPFEATWTIEQARGAGLSGKATWKQYPAAMLRARAISEVVRMGASECVIGMDYSAEEMRDVEATAAPVVKPTGMAAIRQAVAPQNDAGAGAPAEVESPAVGPSHSAPALPPNPRGRMFALLAERNITDPDEQRQGMSAILGRDVVTRASLTPDEMHRISEHLVANVPVQPALDEEPS